MTAQDLGRALKERKFEPHRNSRHRGFRARLLENGHDVSKASHDPLVTP